MARSEQYFSSPGSLRAHQACLHFHYNQQRIYLKMTLPLWPHELLSRHHLLIRLPFIIMELLASNCGTKSGSRPDTDELNSNLSIITFLRSVGKRTSRKKTTGLYPKICIKLRTEVGKAAVWLAGLNHSPVLHCCEHLAQAQTFAGISSIFAGR